MENEEKQVGDFWTTEFAPKSIDDMVLSQGLKDKFINLVKNRSRFNLLLEGGPGIGKTTLANILAKELDAHVLFIKCGIEGNVDTAKTKIVNFCEAYSMDDRPKLVILDELDSASGTQDNSFQKVLRNVIVEKGDTMFIGTCNYGDKVIGPLQSRLGGTPVKLHFEAKDLVVRIKKILETKNVAYSMDGLKKFAMNVIKANYPDIRAIVSILAMCSSTGELVVDDRVFSPANKEFMKQLVEMALTKDVFEVRKFYIQNKIKIDNYIDMASELFNYVMDSGLVKDRQKILDMTDAIYQLNVVVDKEIQFYKLVTVLGK